MEHLDRSKLLDLSDDAAVEMEDMRHPSPVGTKQILMMMKDFNGEPLIWNNKFIINDQRYRRIQTIPRYECKGCHVFIEKPIDASTGLRPDCHEGYKKRNGNPLLSEIIKRVSEEAKKRKRSHDQSDDEYAKKPFGADGMETTPSNSRSYADVGKTIL